MAVIFYFFLFFLLLLLSLLLYGNHGFICYLLVYVELRYKHSWWCMAWCYERDLLLINRHVYCFLNKTDESFAEWNFKLLFLMKLSTLETAGAFTVYGKLTKGLPNYMRFWAFALFVNRIKVVKNLNQFCSAHVIAYK